MLPVGRSGFLSEVTPAPGAANAKRQPFFGFRPLELIVAAVVLAQDEIASLFFFFSIYQYARGAGTQSKTHTNRQQGQVLLCYSHRLSEELRGWI